MKRTGAKQVITYIEVDYDPETSDKKKRKRSLTIQMVKAAAIQPPLLPSTPPSRSPPGPSPDSPPRPLLIQNDLNEYSFRKCNGLLPLTLMEEFQAPAYNEQSKLK